jgi:hypothetical protein
LFWTYLVPALPLVLLFDVMVSCLRVYSVPELRDLTAGLDCYRWDSGTVYGAKGENLVDAEEATLEEALWRACRQAREVGMPAPTRLVERC